MRIIAAFLTYVCLAACSATPVPTASERALTRQDSWGGPQAELDAQAILQGMAQARQRAQMLARTAR